MCHSAVTLTYTEISEKNTAIITRVEGKGYSVKFCKLSRLRWAGHVIGQDDDDLSRRVLLSEPGGKRPRGRPTLRWEDGVEEDVTRLGCRNWKIVALNRERWRKLLKEAEAHPGL